MAELTKDIESLDVERPESVNVSATLDSDHSLKWQKEIDLHRSIDSAIIVEGNINDKVVYKEDDCLDIVSLDTYFYNYLHKIGYKVVVFFDHVTGFRSFNSKEYEEFSKIAKASKAETEREGASDNGESQNKPQTCGKNHIFGFLQTDAQESLLSLSLDVIRDAMKNTQEPVAIVMCEASRYVPSPDNMTEQDHYVYSRLSLATKEIINPKNSELHNIMFFLAEKSNDIPAWFYLNNPFVKTISIPMPDNSIRKMYIDSYYDTFNEDFPEESEEEIAKNKKLFVSCTDGMKLKDLESLRKIMKREHLPVSEVSKGVNKFKFGVDLNPWEDENLRDQLPNIEDDIQKRVKGQSNAVAKATSIIKTAVLGLAGLQHSSSKSKPRGVMFLAGPTGTGKTELAKAISEWVFKSDSHVIRFDMSEYSQSHSDQRLLGAPPGYVGYDAGGQLTEAVKRDPFSVLLFDEIEKAHPTVLDKFLQILEDGRMTDGKGETVYFSDTLIIFTSNLGMFEEYIDPVTHEKRKRILKEYGSDGCNDTGEIADKKYEDYCKSINNKISEFFTYTIQRPEIKNRIGENFIIFNYISVESAKIIAKKQLSTIIDNLKERKDIDLVIEDTAMKDLENVLTKREHLEQGGRGVGNVIEMCILRPLSNYIVQNKIWDSASIKVKNIVREDGIYKFICE